MSNTPQLEVRNLSFELGPEVPRHWHGAGAAVTAFFNNLSILFPAGERFFIASVKAHRELLFDPRLQEEVRLFCAQEAIHGREHTRYNEMLRSQGYPIAAMLKSVSRILDTVGWLLPRRGRLAVTCALEHFTALLAQLVLEDPRLLDSAHPAMASLWRWHAAEESEHKAVAFDVYKETGGGYAERTLLMFLTSLVFWGWIFRQQVRLMRTERMLFSQKEWGALVRFLFIEPGGMGRLFRLYLHYYRPSFHPADLSTQELLQRWKRDLPHAIGFTRAEKAP